jgi:hypothetical protein
MFLVDKESLLQRIGDDGEELYKEERMKRSAQEARGIN